MIFPRLLGIMMAFIFLCQCVKEDPCREERYLQWSNCPSDSVYFQDQILPLLISKCAVSGCHDNTTQADGVQLWDYYNIIYSAGVEPGDPEDSDLYEVLVESDYSDEDMPPAESLLDACEIEMIRLWIEQGAQNNRCK